MYVCEGEPLAQYGSGETEKPEVDNDGTYLSFLEIGKELQYFSGFAVFSYPKFCAAHTPIAQHLRFNTRLCKTHKRRYNLPALQIPALPSLPSNPARNKPSSPAPPWVLSPSHRHCNPQTRKAPQAPPNSNIFPVMGADLLAPPHFLPLHPLP